MLPKGCVFERFPLFTNLSSRWWTSSYIIHSGSELAGQTHFLIIGINSDVSEAVMIAHTQGLELFHEILVPRTQIFFLIFMQGEVVEVILREI